MQFSTRSKVGSFLSLFALVTIISAFVLNGVLIHATTTRAASAPAFTTTKGILKPTATVNLNKLATVNASRAAGKPVPRGIRHIHRANMASSNANGQISSSH